MKQNLGSDTHVPLKESWRAFLDLDEAHLAAQTFGDTDLARELLNLFSGQCARLIPEILENKTLTLQADSAHALKGAARGLGIKRLAALLDALETNLRSGQNLTSEQVTLLESENQRILTVIEKALRHSMA
jgi:HPt (histidine-containing phosphotransfer) domain-containing protein